MSVPVLCDVADGLVVVDCDANGWYLIRIGRARKTKRLWLSRNEAEQLIDKLTQAVRR